MIQSTKKAQIERKWHIFDATDKVLGRLSTQLAPLLTGKKKPYFTLHLDCGDHVVVTNTEKIKVSGRKESQKIYQRYSGYPGGLKERTLSELRSKFPTRILEHAVSGMLPDNKLKAEWMSRLHLFVGDQHPYANMFKSPTAPVKSPRKVNPSTTKSTKSLKTVKPVKPTKLTKTK